MSNMSDRKPFEIARETLKQLTTKKLVPTPANYQAIYNEIAGLPPMTPFPVDILRDIAKSLPTKRSVNPCRRIRFNARTVAMGSVATSILTAAFIRLAPRPG